MRSKDKTRLRSSSPEFKGEPSVPVTRSKIVDEARTWLGVKWVHQGRTRLGIDCAGLIVLVAKALDLSDYDSVAYHRTAVSTNFLNHFAPNMDSKPILDALPGDVLLFRDSAFPCHSAIVGTLHGGPSIIHAHALRRMVVEERLDQGDWLDRRVACFAFRGVGD